MINNHGKYCGNEGEIEACIYCTPVFTNSESRANYLKNAASSVDKILYPSRYFRRLHKSWGFPDDKAYVNYNGVNLPTKDYTKQSGKHITFGFVGGPGPIKGADLILEAFNEIKNNDYELILVDAAQNIGKTWSAYKNWKLPGTLKIHPAYDQTTMDNFYKKIDVLLFPSQWKESFGLTVREALCRDIWVISTDEGGVADDLEDGINATTIPMIAHHLPLKMAIEQILQSSDKIKHHVNPSKHKIRSYKQQANELLDVYTSILETS